MNWPAFLDGPARRKYYSLMTVSAIIFDMDGVLIDSGGAHHESWRRLAADLGCDVTEEQFAATFGRQNSDIIPLLFGQHLSSSQVDQLSDRKESIYRDSVRGHIQEIDGATALVHECHRAGIPLAIGSSAPQENIDLALLELGLGECFSAIVHAGHVSRGKPDPQVFLLAADRLGIAPVQCAVIEDAPSGVQAALAAGMYAIGLTTSHPAKRLAYANLVIDHLTELGADYIRTLKAG